ncbi:MAG: dienelactone hydrolase family protein [Acidobacteriota bacterium]
MGKRVQFQSNGHTCDGYLARPEDGRGPAVVVIQEWWGLVPHIEKVTERFASEGFLAMAPDLYHGSTTQSPDEAGRLLMELNAERAGKEISAAGQFLLSQPECTSKVFGVVGFCMGGALAQYAATHDNSIGAAVSFYGGFKKVDLDWDDLGAPMIFIYGQDDGAVPAAEGQALANKLTRMGKDVEAVVYPGANHAFFNDTGPNYKKEAAEDAWKRTIALFRTQL